MAPEALTTLKLLVEKGFFLFPIVPNTKEAWPGFSWCDKSSNDMFQIEAWIEKNPDSNWGIDAGKSKCLIVDVDCKAGKRGPESLAELDISDGVPETLEFITPTGGKHLVYLGLSRNRVNMLPGIDVRSDRGYIVAPGSVIDGKKYEILHDRPIKKAPQWLCSMVGAPVKPDPMKDIPICEIDLDQAKERAIELACNTEPAVTGDAGDTRTFGLALKMRGFGLPQDVCLDIMDEHYNPRCEPPWEYDELEGKVNNAYRYAKDRIGHEAPEARVAEAQMLFGDDDPGSEPGNSPQKLGGISRLRAFCEIGLQSLPQEWILEDWIPSGNEAFTLFSGEGGTGKSLVSIGLAMAISAGLPWEGIKTTKQPVIYFSCEDGEDEIDRRVYNHRNYPGREIQGRIDRTFSIQSRAGLNSLLCMGKEGALHKGPFYGEMERILAPLGPDPKVIILDTLVDMFGGSENNRSDVNLFVKLYVGSICKKYNCTAILLAHPPKNTGSTYSGSTAWNGSVRNRCFLKHQNSEARGPYRCFTNEKANYGPERGEIVLKYHRGVYVRVSDIEMETMGNSAILAAVQANQDAGIPLSMSPQSPTYWKKIKIVDDQGCPIAKKIIEEHLKELIASGKIKSVSGKSRGNGLYVA